MIARAFLIGFALFALFAGCGSDKQTILTDCLGQPPSRLCPSSPTETGTPTPTPDNSLHVSCPVTPGETVFIDSTPFVILARACTPTPAN